MNDTPSETDVNHFFSVAVDLGLLTAEESSQWLPQAMQSGQTASEFALHSGAMSATDVDIVNTLCNPDEIIPGYRIESLLGQGGMGVVYRAEQLNLRRQVALKTILVSRLGDQNALHRFEREAQTIGQLRHPNIIAAFDFGRHAGRFFLSLELVDGDDLGVRIKKHGPLREAIALGLIRQAAAGLAHAESNHVVHRDIKPANLILVEPPEGYPLPPGMPMVKIADFGLALLQSDVDDSTRLTRETTLGSPHYMAPEQFESSDVDFRADMYSLGATFIEILTGKPPFQGLKLSQLLAAKFAGDEKAFASLPRDLNPVTIKLIQRLMSVKPENRPDSYQTLIKEIDSALASTEDFTGTVLLDSVSGQGSDSHESTKEFVPAGSLLPTSSTVVDLATRRTWRFSAKFWWVVSFIVTLSVVSFFALQTFKKPSDNFTVRPLQKLIRSRTIGQSHQLFNGNDTGGWEIGYGSWIWVLQKALLEGTDGLIHRPIPQTSENEKSTPRSLLWYRLEIIFAPILTTQPDQETAQELHFEVNLDGKSKFVLRRTGTEVELLVRNVENNRLSSAFSEQSTLLVSNEKSVAVTLDRLPSGWVLVVNGEPFRTIRSLHIEELPEIQLQAVGGPVEFSDAMLTELSIE